MKAIYASKLYRTSSRKAKIQSAINNPLNVELVQQLREYLDDDVVEQELVEPKQDVPEVDLEDTDIIEDQLTNTNPSALHVSAPSGSPSSNGSSKDDGSVSDDVIDDGSESADDESVESSVTASTKVIITHDIDADTIRGILDARDDTNGVARIVVKDNELWIHYQDKINLNNVMEPVIAVLNSIGYTNLEFSRLARTENAIVFLINEVHNPVQPIVENEE